MIDQASCSNTAPQVQIPITTAAEVADMDEDKTVEGVKKDD